MDKDIDGIDWELLKKLSEALGYTKFDPYKVNEYLKEAIQDIIYNNP